MKQNNEFDMILLKRILLLSFLYHSLYAERRIVGGKEVTKTQKRYMVYLVLAPESPRHYDTWICGGAIINPKYVLTSAACIEDVEKAYVVAGYNEYIKLADFRNNLCAKKTRRRIIATAIPIAYSLGYEKLGDWTALDIAVVEVHKPYDYNDVTFEKYCSYPPKEIKVNFDLQYEQPGTHVMALGWGHPKKARAEGDTKDYNVKKLRWVTTVIFSKELCKEYFKSPKMAEIIDKYMLCTFEPSTLSEDGANLDYFDPPISENVIKILDNNLNSTTTSKPQPEKPKVKLGICQNDHGGPLVAWIRRQETVVGVASMFDFNKKFECQPPNLFTSTALNRQLIDCFVNNIRRSQCDQITKGNTTYKIIRRRISWSAHDDELIENGTRSQSSFNCSKEERLNESRRNIDEPRYNISVKKIWNQQF